jgi:serine hydrolase
MTNDDRPVLILPGLYNSGPEHWQSRWEAAHRSFRRVVQSDWETPRRKDWVARLDEEVRATPDAVLVAHSSSCALVAHWASTCPAAPVHGALLVAPSDPEGPAYPKGPTGFAPMPMQRLAFPTIVVASTDDIYVTMDRAQSFAGAWGSRLVNIGSAGHINSQSALGDWPFGLTLLEELIGD